ncbi:hypothetical protein H4R34_003921 [Dimargaris verticillata]|uniref:NAD(P)-binding protein n=1 Tax=Dimargaris verticillata TaxID=2761393 RepID=A0A9W8B573_9FUNG|nr:hypothetical protein H4R34_003921 [Dimargaris verticillata]
MPQRRVALITGGNSGVGFGIAQRLIEDPATHDVTVVLACRSAHRFKAARNALLSIRPQATVELLSLDTSDTQAVLKAAEQFMARFETLDVLFCNAGMLPAESINYVQAAFYFLTNTRGFFSTTVAINQTQGLVTPEGMGTVFATNLFGHYLLIHALRPALLKAAKARSEAYSRVVWTGSCLGSGKASMTHWVKEDYQHVQGPNPYESSKFLVDVASQIINKKFGGDGIVSYTTEPGVSASNIYASVNNLLVRIVYAITTLLLRLLFVATMTITPYNGAISEVYAATAPVAALDTRYKYLSRCAPLGTPFVDREKLCLDPALVRDIQQKLDALVARYSNP